MSKGFSRHRGTALRGMVLIAGLSGLTACADGARLPDFLKPKAEGGEENVVARAATADSARTVERDIEAPEVFQTTEAGLWDGRPSLGGVWVAHPDVKEPERVIIRNEQNGQFVIGALFRRERETPGPRLQISSDAAAALGILAGQPTNVDVVALRREEVVEEPVAEIEAEDGMIAEPGALAEPAAIAEGTIDPIAATAAAALESGDSFEIAAASPAPEPTPAVAPVAPPAASKLGKPFIQIGIFSVEENARNTATAMRQAGMVPTVQEKSSSGKTFWRVIVGPAQNTSELNILMKKIKESGFTDAFATSS